jgi:UDP-N-acetylmuramyl pentapeptide synthase
LVGHTMVFPLLAAVATAREEGVSERELRQRLATATPVERRMAPIALPNQSWGIVDDRKSVPETVAAALKTLDAIPARRKWVVLGELGMPPDHPIEALYRSTGAALGRVCDLLVLTTPDPEKRDHLFSGATSSGLGRECITSTAGSLQAAADHLNRHLEPGDIVLFKGRFPERLARIALALEGVEVRCWVPRCGARLLECRTCPALTRP